jgi:hypothetical protein
LPIRTSPCLFAPLQRWKREHADLYARVGSEVLPQVKRELAAEYTDLARHELAVSRKVLDRLDTEADEIPARDLAGTLRNVKVSAAVGTDKSQLLRDEPTQITQPRSSAEILRELRINFPDAFVDSTAEEEKVQDARVVEQLPEGDSDSAA